MHAVNDLEDRHCLANLLVLIKSSGKIRGLFVECARAILVHALRKYPVAEYPFRLFADPKVIIEQAENLLSLVGIEEREKILQSARLFMYANLKVDPGEMERIANAGPVDMDLQALGPYDCRCLSGRERM